MSNPLLDIVSKIQHLIAEDIERLESRILALEAANDALNNASAGSVVLSRTTYDRIVKALTKYRDQTSLRVGVKK